MSLIKFLIGIFVCFLFMPLAILTMLYLFIKNLTDIGNDFLDFLRRMNER